MSSLRRFCCAMLNGVGSRIGGCYARVLVMSVAVVAVDASVLRAETTSSLDTTESEQYILIARHLLVMNSGGPGVHSSNSELGANKAPVPSPSGAPFGPSLLGNVPDINCNAQVVFSGIGGLGNIAVTDVLGTLDLSGVGLYADLGAHLAGNDTPGGAGSDLNVSQNSRRDSTHCLSTRRLPSTSPYHSLNALR